MSEINCKQLFGSFSKSKKLAITEETKSLKHTDTRRQNNLKKYNILLQRIIHKFAIFIIYLSYISEEFIESCQTSIIELFCESF